MKNQKLNLQSIKVKSFVTKMDKVAEQTVKGGNQTWEMNGGDCIRQYTVDCQSAFCTVNNC